MDLQLYKSTHHSTAVPKGELVYPFVDEDDYGDQWGQAIVAYCEELNTKGKCYDKIEFAFMCEVKRDNDENLIFRTNPDYHSYPWDRRGWFDWAMANWIWRKFSVRVAAKLLWWGTFLETKREEVACMVCVDDKSLMNYHPLKNDIISCFHADKLEQEICVIDANDIASVSYVLPLVVHREQEVLQPHEDCNYFMVSP